MGGDGDWFYPGMSPFQFVKQRPRSFYGSQTGAQGHEAGYPFSRKHVYAPDASLSGRNRAVPGGEANRQWKETSSPNAGSIRKTKVTTIPVQDGNEESLKSGNLQGKKFAMPSDLEGRVVGKSKGDLEGQNAVGFSENAKKIVPGTVSHNSAACNRASGAMMKEDTAAILIQSRFRGYMVRRTAPLNCLRVIMSVMSQLRKLKTQIITDEYMDRLRADPKERVKLSETIMSLLLRLDALQGVHSTVREIRKAAVREAVALQETVDSELQKSLSETQERSKASPAAECNCSVNASDSTPSDDQDTEKRLETASVTHFMSGTFSENVEESIGSAVPMELSKLLDEENETRHLGGDTDSYITSDEILYIDERDSDGHREMASHPHTTEDDTTVATKSPKLDLEDDMTEHEDAGISCKDVATTGATRSEGENFCSDKNMEQNESSLENGSPAEADSDALHLLQSENEELKRMLKRCRTTNELQTSLICDLRERLSLLERRLEEKSKTAVKSSSKCKKRSSKGGRISERRSIRNRNRSRQPHIWSEDENCNEAVRDDDY
ncbi:hypothetical protein O6H91_07G103000 [Diphasiastrum complanatum]|uniref:Uncharacterized protein n=1 Tax=Diphasiastrum complanatum TaxID=34168 RepID=A0ACC2D836_DIPCM|nr:hypothetical protein O6H91_07G103000 [Diphasiastrum complanatum]